MKSRRRKKSAVAGAQRDAAAAGELSGEAEEAPQEHLAVGMIGYRV
jgi:hypothetical protein